VYLGQEGSGSVTGEGKIPTTVKGFDRLIETLNLAKGTKIGLETGPQAMWVARLLSALGMQPIVIDAREVRQKARRIGQKCDRRDAFEICDGLRRGLYTSIVYVPGPEIQRLRQILSERRYFVRVCTSQVNRAKSALRSVGLGQEAKTLTTLDAWHKLLRRPAVAWVRETLARHSDVWRVAREKVVALEGELREALKPFEETVRRLQTTPGVGPITAATYLAVIATPHRFADSGRVVSYIGLVPSTYDTGLVQRHGHITKRGSCELRAMLCEAAHSAARPTHPLNPYWVRVCAKQGYKRAVVAVAQRLGRITAVRFNLGSGGVGFAKQMLVSLADHGLRFPNRGDGKGCF
jgi:transposase